MNKPNEQDRPQAEDEAQMQFARTPPTAGEPLQAPPAHHSTAAAMIFSPANALMDRLNVAWKFALLGLMSLVAIAVVVYSLFASLDQVIRTSQKELQGIALIKPISQTVQAIQQHRGLSAGLLGGYKTIRGMRAAKERDITEAFKELEKKLPPRLTSSEDWPLVSSENWSHIKADWELIRKEGLNWTVAENFPMHTDLIDDLQIFHVAAADEHALTLDPEIDTYYLIINTVQQLPYALEHLAQIRGYGTSILAQKQVTEDRKVQIKSLIAELGNALKLLKIDLNKASRYNPAMRIQISAASDDIDDATRKIIGIVESDILTGYFATTPYDFFEMTTVSIDRNYTQLYDSLLPMAETLIKARIARAENTLRTSVGIALLLFLVVVYFSAGICYAIVGNIRSLARSAHAFAGGDLRERVDLGTRDEFGKVGDSFNEMADGFSAMLEARHEDDARLHATIETAMDAVVRMDSEGVITGWNGQAEKVFGWSREEALGRMMGETIIPPQYREAHKQGLKRFLRSGGEGRKSAVLNQRIEITGLHRDGREFPVELSIAPIKLAGKYEFSAFIRDITGRKAAEEQLQESAKRYKRITDGLTDYQYTVCVENGHAVSTLQSPGCVTVTGYTEEEFAADPYLWIWMVAPEDRDKVIEHTQQVLAGNDVPSIEHRIIRKNGDIRWVSDTTILFKDVSGNLQVYDGVIKDITERKITEGKIQHYVAQLESAFMRTVEVVITLSEMRDPYTSGHERRVAEIAVAIATELGLDARRIEGIRVAGCLHDIGKIGIPSEVLSKPGKISTDEYLLIKEHAQAGYDILKDVAFPWPVAEVAWQHHERIDGSGYPRGLKGDEIMFEARIISVADVVEAMASHRPYRPGHGIGDALAEVERGSGTAYDPAVAEACLRMFREKGYVLPV